MGEKAKMMMSPFEAHILIQQSTFCSSSPKKQSTISHKSFSCADPDSLLREALLSHRLDANVRFKGESLLATTIKSGRPNLLQLFVEQGADPNLKSYENGRYEPALITAVRYKSLWSVQILLEHGANLSHTNFYGYSSHL